VDVASTFSAASALRRTVDPRRIVLRAAHVVVGARIVVVRADVEAIASCRRLSIDRASRRGSGAFADPRLKVQDS
jgi:hypothetical protein